MALVLLSDAWGAHGARATCKGHVRVFRRRPAAAAVFFHEASSRMMGASGMMRRAGSAAVRATVRPRYLSTTARVLEAEAQSAPANPKITEIVDSIEKLTLLEASDLVTQLKVRGPVRASPLTCRRV